MDDVILCYICYECETQDNLYATNPKPCICRGTIAIHTRCLENALKTSRNCSICKTKYNLTYLPKKDGKELIIERDILGRQVEYTINERGEKHGTYIVKNKYGRTATMQTYINGVMEGPYVEYYDDGQIKSVCKCRNNKIEGEYCEWSSSGDIIEESHYVNGVKHGDCLRWDFEGYTRVAQVINYIDGEADIEF
jgi:antitoxin component YwqK of YwqJK toxin-antitoxin module